MGGIFRKPKKRTPPTPPGPVTDPRRVETAKKTAPEQKKEEPTPSSRIGRNVVGGQLLGFDDSGSLLSGIRNPRV